jgi:hypothetical protein
MESANPSLSLCFFPETAGGLLSMENYPPVVLMKWKIFLQLSFPPPLPILPGMAFHINHNLKNRNAKFHGSPDIRLEI